MVVIPPLLVGFTGSLVELDRLEGALDDDAELEDDDCALDELDCAELDDVEDPVVDDAELDEDSDWEVVDVDWD